MQLSQTMKIGIAGILVMLLVFIGGYFMLKSDSESTITIDQKSPSEMSDDYKISLGDLNQLIVDTSPNIYIRFSDSKSGLELATADDEVIIFKPDVDVVYATIFLGETVLADTVAVTLVSESTGDKLGPIVARVKIEDGYRFAEVKIDRATDLWVPSTYRMTAFLPEGIEVSQVFNVQL